MCWRRARLGESEETNEVTTRGELKGVKDLKEVRKNRKMAGL
jgi:hypothetical protein